MPTTMENSASLSRALVDQLTYYRETVPVFRVRERTVEELEEITVDFARWFIATSSDIGVRVHQTRQEDATDFYLPDGARARVYHASGAVTAKRNLGSLNFPITDTTDTEPLQNRAVEVVNSLDLDRFQTDGERLEFERLWRIQATGMTQSGEQGSVVLCRAVGAFRRFLDDLPVWGRASVVVKLAGEGIIDGVGIDWRPRAGEPVTYAKPIDPEAAANLVIEELMANVPGGDAPDDDYGVDQFSLGYLSLPKRRDQAYLQPVYVALLRARGWTTLNRLIVVPATVSVYEPISRIVAAPPKDATKPEPAQKRPR